MIEADRTPGTLEEVGFIFRDRTGTEMDPVTATFSYIAPGSTQVDLAVTITAGVLDPLDTGIVRVSAGRLYFLLNLSRSGIWYARWYGEGDVQGGEDFTYNVAKSRFTA